MKDSILFLAGLLVALVFVSQGNSQEPKVIVIPHQNDETPLIKVKADAQAYVGKTFIICGGIRIDDFYHGNSENARDTCYSLAFNEFGKDTSVGSSDTVYMYLDKSIGHDIVDEITKATAGGENQNKIVRVRVSIRPQTPDNNLDWDCQDVHDVQFMTSDCKGWRPWSIEGDLDKRREQVSALQASRQRAAMEAARIGAAEKAADEKAKWRTWTDSSGTHKIEAKFSGIIAGNVKLAKRDGVAIMVPLDDLSEVDRTWIKDRGKIAEQPNVRPALDASNETAAKQALQSKEALRLQVSVQQMQNKVDEDVQATQRHDLYPAGTPDPAIRKAKALKADMAKLANLQARLRTAIEQRKSVVPARTGMVAEYRTWTDATGQHAIEAKFSGLIAGSVKLFKRDGTAITVPLEKLSADDQGWIKNRGNGIEQPNMPPATIASNEATKEPAPQTTVTGGVNENANSVDEAKMDMKRGRWVDTSYKNTVNRVGKNQWIEIDDATKKVNWHFTEVSRNPRFLELRRREIEPDKLIDYRIYTDHMEVERGNNWGWISNGYWEPVHE